MNKNLDISLKCALEKEFSWINDFENPYAGYAFSSQFKSNMESIIPRAGFTYVSIGNKRIRKALLAALIALLAIAITGCAFTVHYVVEWNEKQNDAQGTLDVSFELSGESPSAPRDMFLPSTPQGYVITDQYSDDFSYTITYSNPQGHEILCSISNDIENMSISLDNEGASFEKTTINGQKGYAYSKDGINALFWADSIYFYELQGNCEMDTLLTMAGSMAGI